MLTVLDSITLSTNYLAEKGIESARMNAEIMLAEILKCKRLELYLKYDRPLTGQETHLYRSFISRRSKFEPLQYIVGHVEFYGLNFIVNPDVLIPRQETEILVETVIDNHKNSSNLTLLDIGTGSGIIPVCIAKNFSDCKITATDISKEALKVASGNASENKISEKIEFIENDILADNYKYLGQFDVIISNPPYVSLKEYETLQREIREFEPKSSVTDENDGYVFYKRISEVSAQILKSGGTLYFEVGQGQCQTVRKYLEDNCFKEIKTVKDYLGIDRVVYGSKN